VFDAVDPAGPFTEVAEPHLGVNASAAAGGLNNGDEDLFVDNDGKCYLVYTDWKKGGDVVIEELDAAYHSGTGNFARLGQSSTEAPSLFRRNNLYYITYSDPNCGYCGGTGTSYKVASAPLGPWAAGSKVSANSCGGQPNHVSILPGRTGVVYIFQSDLWLNGNPTETLANQFWAPLSFDANGKIANIVCSASTTLN
jgi:beta-xylosidase